MEGGELDTLKDPLSALSCVNLCNSHLPRVNDLTGTKDNQGLFCAQRGLSFSGYSGISVTTDSGSELLLTGALK